MRRQNRSNSFDHFPPIGLEGIRGVVESMPKQHPDEKICKPIEEKFDRRVVNDTAAFCEATAKNTVDAGFLEFMPIPDDIAGVIGLVCHHDDAGGACEVVQTERDCTPKAVWTGVANWAQSKNFFALGFEDRPSGIGGTVIDDKDFVRNRVELQLKVKVLNGGGDTSFFVTGRDDNREHGKKRWNYSFARY